MPVEDLRVVSAVVNLDSLGLALLHSEKRTRHLPVISDRIETVSWRCFNCERSNLQSYIRSASGAHGVRQERGTSSDPREGCKAPARDHGSVSPSHEEIILYSWDHVFGGHSGLPVLDQLLHQSCGTERRGQGYRHCDRSDL